MKTSPQQLSFDFLTDRELDYEEVRGRVKHIIYDNPETGWKVIEVAALDADTLYKLTGYLPNVSQNDVLFCRCTKS